MIDDLEITKTKKTIRPPSQELQKQLDERMAKFLAKGGVIEKVDPMKSSKGPAIKKLENINARY